ncbi:MAG: hypothetical protein M5R36_09875 [Deltaproteobacteria bacterium]|nr:hypothetical protein [Deltaproteobacteria bacterium]
MNMNRFTKIGAARAGNGSLFWMLAVLLASVCLFLMAQTACVGQPDDEAADDTAGNNDIRLDFGADNDAPDSNGDVVIPTTTMPPTTQSEPETVKPGTTNEK